MQGFPPARLFFVLLAFGLLAIPLIRLTSAEKVAPAPASAAVGRTSAVMEVRFSHRPTRLVVKDSLDQRILAELPADAESPWTGEAELRLIENRAEVRLEAAWPEDGSTEHAVTIRLEPEGQESREHTVWAGAESDEIVLFRW